VHAAVALALMQRPGWTLRNARAGAGEQERVIHLDWAAASPGGGAQAGEPDALESPPPAAEPRTVLAAAAPSDPRPDAPRNAPRSTAPDAVLDATRDATDDARRDATPDAAPGATIDVASEATRDATRDAAAEAAGAAVQDVAAESQPGAAPEAAAAAGPVTAEAITAPTALPGNAPPRYPGAARRRALEGSVLLRVRIGVDGSALSVGVLESSGHAMLDSAASDGVAAWRFTPARRGGIAVERDLDVPITFRLRDGVR